MWLEYANLERQYGDTNKVRALFQRALSARTDWPLYIYEEWLMFEREFGTLENLLKCVEYRKKIEVQTETQQNAVQQSTETITPKGKKRKLDGQEEKTNFEGKTARYVSIF